MHGSSRDQRRSTILEKVMISPEVLQERYLQRRLSWLQDTLPDRWKKPFSNDKCRENILWKQMLRAPLYTDVDVDVSDAGDCCPGRPDGRPGQQSPALETSTSMSTSVYNSPVIWLTWQHCLGTFQVQVSLMGSAVLWLHEEPCNNWNGIVCTFY